MGFLTPPIDPATVTCPDAPSTPLPPTATNRDGKQRIIDNDEAGESCRQVVHRTHDKLEAFNSVVEQVNKQAGIKTTKGK